MDENDYGFGPVAIADAPEGRFGGGIRPEDIPPAPPPEDVYGGLGAGGQEWVTPPPPPIPFTPADDIYLQKMERGLSQVRDHVDNGTLDPREGLTLTGTLLSSLAPLRARKEQHEQQQKARAIREVQEQAATAQTMAHEDQVFRARGLNERVQRVTDPMTGGTVTLFEKSPNQWEQIQFPPPPGSEPQQEPRTGPTTMEIYNGPLRTTAEYSQEGKLQSTATVNTARGNQPVAPDGQAAGGEGGPGSNVSLTPMEFALAREEAARTVGRMEPGPRRDKALAMATEHYVAMKLQNKRILQQHQFRAGEAEKQRKFREEENRRIENERQARQEKERVAKTIKGYENSFIRERDTLMKQGAPRSQWPAYLQSMDAIRAEARKTYEKDMAEPLPSAKDGGDKTPATPAQASAPARQAPPLPENAPKAPVIPDSGPEAIKFREKQVDNLSSLFGGKVPDGPLGNAIGMAGARLKEIIREANGDLKNASPELKKEYEALKERIKRFAREQEASGNRRAATWGSGAM